jgi:hypothetical protein
MAQRLAGALAGSLLLVLCSTGSAFAAGPARVTIRVEGQTSTLVPQTALTTSSVPVRKDGAHPCSGTSAGGALEQGTHGNWSGSYNASFGDYLVDTIEGERHPGSPDYWALWINNRSAQVGLCQSELQAGDEVVLFPDRCDYDSGAGGCTNQPVQPLGVQAAHTVKRGAPFEVTVVKYGFDGTPKPEPGATVTGADTPAGSGPGGRATVTLSRAGTASLYATETGAARSGPAPVCAFDSNDGTCGTPDRTAPRLRIDAPRDGHVFPARRGPRVLRGHVRVDDSGLRDVRLRLSRRLGGRCFAYDASSERFRGRSCRTPRGRFFSVGDRAGWSYLLPSRLPAGRYVLDATAIDRNGNRSGLRPGVSRVAFTVRRPR